MRRNQPEWLEHAVFYEIYPQSFKDSNADGIGDFGGIAEKLDYIKELGCNAIWMNPCFMSPFGDAGYDVSDYYTAAPRYGTNEDLKKLFEEIHKRDMRILLDLVPGHTSVDHKWFRESMKAGRNEYTDRYIWTNSIWEEPQGISSIKGISDRDGCCAVNFFSHQPALNYGYYKPDPGKNWQQSMDSEGAKATREELKNIMRFWLKTGCDGFRVDMAGSLVKNDDNGKGTIKLCISDRPATTTCSAVKSRTLEQEAETFPSSLQSILKTTKKQTKADLSAYLPEITIWTDLRGISAETI